MNEDVTFRCGAEHPYRLGVLCTNVNGHPGRHVNDGTDEEPAAWVWDDEGEQF